MVPIGLPPTCWSAVPTWPPPSAPWLPPTRRSASRIPPTFPASDWAACRAPKAACRACCSPAPPTSGRSARRWPRRFSTAGASSQRRGRARGLRRHGRQLPPRGAADRHAGSRGRHHRPGGTGTRPTQARTATGSAQRVLELATVRYEGGIATVLDVITPSRASSTASASRRSCTASAS